MAQGGGETKKGSFEIQPGSIPISELSVTFREILREGKHKKVKELKAYHQFGLCRLITSCFMTVAHRWRVQGVHQKDGQQRY